MPRDARKYLFDAQCAAERITRFCQGKQFGEYQSDDLLRSAVERQFEIIGEVLSQLGRHAPDVLHRIPDHARIIGLRNILIHGYATIDDRIVWGVIESHLPPLRKTIASLLDG